MTTTMTTMTTRDPSNDEMKEYYPENWPDNPFHMGEILLQRKAGMHDHIMTYANTKFRPYLPPSHVEFYSSLPFIAVAAIDGHGSLWATLLFANNPKEKAVGFVQSPDPLSLELHTTPLKGDALESAFQVGSDLSILGHDWERCLRNKVNGRVTAREDGKINFHVDQSVPHCPKYIDAREWTVAKEAPPTNNTSKTEPIIGTYLSKEQATHVDAAGSVFIATCYRGNGEDPRFGTDVNFRGGPPGFIRRSGFTTLFIPEFAGNHHFNNQGNLLLDSRFAMVIPLFASRGMLQLSGTAVVRERVAANDHPMAESTIEFEINKVVQLPAGSLPIQWTVLEDEKEEDEEEIPQGRLRPILILYGSQTGKSELAARRLKKKLSRLSPLMMSLNDAAGLEFAKEKGITHVFCCCSTYADGKPPTNSQAFFDVDIPRLEGVKYSVLALGNTRGYDAYCAAGKALDAKLSAAGLEQIHEIVLIDEAEGRTTKIEDWIQSIDDSLKHLDMGSLADSSPDWASIVWLDTPYPKSFSEDTSLCTENKELVDTSLENRSVRKISFLAPSPYSTGDHLLVQPLNSELTIKRFLNCFKFELSEAAKKSSSCKISHDKTEDLVNWQAKLDFKIEAMQDGVPETYFDGEQMSLYEAAKSILSFSTKDDTTPDLIVVMMESIDQAIKERPRLKDTVVSNKLLIDFLATCSPIIEYPNDTTVFAVFKARFPTVLEFLERYQPLFFEPLYGNPVLKLKEILLVLDTQEPRYYSISSSSRLDPKKVTITVGVLRKKTSQNVQINGVCSNYLESLRPDIDEAEIAVVPSFFKLPANKNAPIIMVGAGTGIAPFIGFLEERNLIAETEGMPPNKMKLFFGCRTEGSILYKEEIASYVDKGLLDLHVALSRSKASPKKYVQDSIREEGKIIADLLLNPETHYYVCGDAKMANGAFEACVQVLECNKKMRRSEAVSFLMEKARNRKWQADVWGDTATAQPVVRSSLSIRNIEASGGLVSLGQSRRALFAKQKSQHASSRILFAEQKTRYASTRDLNSSQQGFPASRRSSHLGKQILHSIQHS
ncbi:MAG: hypothetical protein SGILL_003842 [Bacillariaceae sp.]